MKKKPDGVICRLVYKKSIRNGQYKNLKSWVTLKQKGGLVINLSKKAKRIGTGNTLNFGYLLRFIDKNLKSE